MPATWPLAVAAEGAGPGGRRGWTVPEGCWLGAEGGLGVEAPAVGLWHMLGSLWGSVHSCEGLRQSTG